MATPKRADVLAELRGLEAGIQKNEATLTFTMNGKAWSGADALAFVQTAITSAVAVSNAQAALTEALLLDKQWNASNGATLKGLRDILRLMFGNNLVGLAEFSLEPRKVRTPMSNETLLLRAAKARATRAKRRTLGKRQKAAIKGEVTGVVITPVTAQAKAESGGGGEPTR